MTRFSKLIHTADGKIIETDVYHIPQSAMRKCAHVIMMPSHYRSDYTCRCDDPTDTQMADWGYVWDGKLWQSPPDDAA